MNMTESNLIAMLAEKFGGSEFAFIPHVPNGTAGNKSRTADALAMSVWPSRGLNLFGFEIKCRRNDWIKEKNMPQKADQVARYCDFWYLVVGDEKIVQAGELPETWGLIAPRGEKLVIKKEAQKLEALPLDRKFIAAILRRAADHVFKMEEFRGVRENSDSEQYKKGLADGALRNQIELDNLRHQHERLINSVQDFKRRSGIELNEWNGSGIGDAVKFVMAGGIENRVKQLEYIKRTSLEIADAINKLSALLENKNDG